MTRTLSLAALVIASLGFTTDRAAAQNRVVDVQVEGGVRYDPFTDTHHVNRVRRTVRESALDWNRHHVDPGSLRQVDRIVVDQHGRRVREHGTVWTTNGKPHGKLHRDFVKVTPREDPRIEFVRRQIREILKAAQNDIAFGDYVTARQRIAQADALKAAWNLSDDLRVVRRPVNVERDRATVVFAPNPNTIRDRESLTFRRAPATIERERATVNFAPSIQRDRETVTFSRAPTTVQQQRESIDFTPNR